MHPFYRYLAIVLFVLCPALAPAAPLAEKAKGQTKTERELLAIEEKRRAAIKRGDLKTLARIYAPDFTAIAGSGAVVNRDQLFAVLGRNDPSTTFTTDDISVRVFGNTAIFTARLIGRNPAGSTISSSRFTHIFVKRAGRWQCVAGQSTPLPNAG